MSNFSFIPAWSFTTKGSPIRNVSLSELDSLVDISQFNSEGDVVVLS
jgi:hypothetical protein